MVNRMHTSQHRAAPVRGCDLAVTGMDIHTGLCTGLEAFEKAVYSRTVWIAEHLQMESNGKRPAELRLRQAVQGALTDAGLPQGGSIGVVILSAERQPLGSLPVRRARPLAALCGCSGPVEDIDLDAAAAIAWADDALKDSRLEAVVLGWVSQRLQSAAAIILRRRESVSESSEKLYAIIQAVAAKGEAELLSSQIIQASLTLAGVNSRIIGYAEIAGDLTAEQVRSITNAFHVDGHELTCALGGENPLPLIPAMIKASLCLHRRFLPASPPELGFVSAQPGVEHPFYLVSESRAWFQAEISGARRAVVYFGDIHIVLSEAVSALPRLNQALQNSDLRLYPVAADNQDDLITALRSLKAALSSGSDPHQLSLQVYETYQQQPAALYTAAVMGRGHEDMLREIEYALKGIPAAFEKGTDWQTPLGSAFSPAPVGRQGSVAFVYPGAFNSYVGMAKDLFYLFPHLHERFGEVAADIGSVLCERLVYPRSRHNLSETDAAVLEAYLTDDPIAMLKSGAALSTLYTMILRDVFRIEPAAALGYSLGENSMMFAMGVWNNGDEASQRLSESEVFRTRLSGPQNAVRQYWGLPEADSGAPLWRNYLVMAPPERVLAAMQGESRVYLTHINTPRQVVIGGEPAACQRVIQSLSASSLQAPFNHSLHNEAMQSELGGLVYLHNSPVVSIPKTRLYSAAGYEPLKVEQQEIAEKIGQMLCSCLDFPRLIERVYADGARLFIELGAGSNCSKWVSDTLQGRPHASIGINRRGVDDLTSIVRVLAKLCAHRASLDLSALYLSPTLADQPVGANLQRSGLHEVKSDA